ncbi:MAG: outer membrane lipoprotein chaperone LolA [Pseudomonadota bacterium]
MSKKCFILLLFISTNAFAGSDALDLFYQKTDSLSANFTQTIRDTFGKLIETSSGRLVIKRPDQFVLNYTKPDEQSYISDGKTLWVYDVELEQVTIKKADEKLLNSPALLISSNRNIRDNYFVKESVDYDAPDNDIFILTPKNVDEENSMMFANIQLTFFKQRLMEIKMTDNFDQITRLNLYNQEVNSKVDDKVFAFIIPADVDVIGTVE